MKKLISLALVLAMALSVLAGCGATPDNGGASNDTAAPASALEVLENIWGKYTEDEMFPVIGGNMESPVDGAPGNYDMAYAENLPYNLVIPEAELGNVTEAATMIHMMNANTFTAGVIKLADGVDVAAFASTMHDALVNNHWMCGMPEYMVIADMGGSYLLVAFGVNDAMTPFQAHLTEAYAGVTPLYSESMV